MQNSRNLPAIRKLLWVLALTGLALNLLLLIKGWTGGTIAGCGGGSACDALLHSRWSEVFGIPVTAFGLLVYVGALLGLTERCRRLLPPLVGVIAGAAGWFIYIQIAVVGRFCPWCMIAHATGLALGLLSWQQRWLDEDADSPQQIYLGSAALTAVAISVLQFMGPQPVTHRVEKIISLAPLPADAAATSVSGDAMSRAKIHALGNGPKAVFEGGKRVYDLTTLPHLGSPKAPHAMVEYFDYQCPACQTMHRFLATLMAKHPDAICLVTLPVPLERSCNRDLRKSDQQHPGSCEITQLALALWRAKPEAFPAFHQALLAGSTAPAARQLALKTLPEEELDAVLSDPWIDELIHANITDWLAFSASSRNLPKLLITDTRILHGLPSSEADFIRVMEKELGL